MPYEIVTNPKETNQRLLEGGTKCWGVFVSDGYVGGVQGDYEELAFMASTETSGQDCTSISTITSPAET